MVRNHLTGCLVGAAAAAVLLIAFGVNPGTLLYGVAALACPLMMVVMMRGMVGGYGHRHGVGADRGDRRSARAEATDA